MIPTLLREGELVLWVKSANRDLEELAVIHFLILRNDFHPNGFLPRGTLSGKRFVARRSSGGSGSSQ